MLSCARVHFTKSTLLLYQVYHGLRPSTTRIGSGIVLGGRLDSTAPECKYSYEGSTEYAYYYYACHGLPL